jgi:hypothetical protein
MRHDDNIRGHVHGSLQPVLGEAFDVAGHEQRAVAASYSELIKVGHLVPARVYQPPRDLKNDLALDPLDAWAKYSGGALTFGFTPLVATAYEAAQRFRDNSIRADVIEANTAKRERDETLELFKRGEIRVILNVNTMTEGVDVPEAGCVILARSFGHVGGYLQAGGRALRPAVGKSEAVIIDLCGATLRHGPPDADREYSLTGKAISGGNSFGGGGGRDAIEQSVVGVDLVQLGAGKNAPKAVELKLVDMRVRRTEYRRLLKLTREHGLRDGFAAVKYREKFGEEPRREWTGV